MVQRESRNAFVGSPQWYEVEKCPGMRKKDGKILLSVSIHFEDSDSKLQSIQEVTCLIRKLRKLEVNLTFF